MIGKYPSYKDSDVMWFGEIPSHWNMYPIKHLFSERNERNDDGNKNYLSIVKDKGVILYSEKGNVGNKTSDRPENYKMVYVNDIVINSMNITIGSVGKSIHNGCLSSVYIVLKPNDSINSSYYDYIFSHKSFQKSLKRISYGIMEIRESLNKIEFYVEKLPLPPLPEQTQIVSFLDTKTQKIDELIKKTDKKIELLKEKRTSLINEIVTGKKVKIGNAWVEPVETKDSGVEWIGEIPSWWEVSKLKYNTLTPVRYGMNISSDKYVDEGIRFIRITDLTDWGELIKDNGKYLIKECIKDEFLLEKYDLLLCRSGHTVGKSYLHLEDGDYTSGGYLVRFNFGDYSKSKFIFYVSKTDFYWYWIQLNTVTSTIENVNGEKYSNMVYPKPPNTEQTQIVEYLDEQTQKIDSTIEKETQRIELLKEYRQSLISEVVTGKIDVRGKL